MTGLTDAPFDLVVDPEKGDRTIVYGYRFDKLNSGIYLTDVFEQTRHKKGRRAKPRNGFYILICGGFESKLL